MRLPPSPIDNYNHARAISFKEGAVKHVYFVAETKDSISSMEMREIEKIKIECARKFFSEFNRKINPDNVKYDVVNSNGVLMKIIDAKAISEAERDD
jgi:type III restriction enzyme